MKRIQIPQKAKTIAAKLVSRKTVPATSTDVKRMIHVLQSNREIRANEAKNELKFWGLSGATIGYLSSMVANPSFRAGVAIIGANALAFGGTKAGIKFFQESKQVKKATTLVGRALEREARKNQQIRNALESKRFVIVDGKGNIKLTNIPRIAGIGRIRLSTREILKGNY